MNQSNNRKPATDPTAKAKGVPPRPDPNASPHFDGVAGIYATKGNRAPKGGLPVGRTVTIIPPSRPVLVGSGELNTLQGVSRGKK